MFGSKFNTANAQKEFFEQFQREYGKEVEKVEFAQLLADTKTFSDLNLIPYLGEQNLSGLVIFCKDSLYFYSFPNDAYMGIIKRDALGSGDNKSQCICLTDLNNLKATVPQKKRLSFLFPEDSRIINLSALISSTTIHFSLSFLKNAEPVYEEIKKILNS
ncbi:MAG: hypothetical protein J5857_12265 [Treponema sp.]|nr:hypothetical protein [Treponema sp.]